MKPPRIHAVEIPNEEQGIIASLLRLADPALEGLEHALCEAKPTLDRQDLTSQLRREPALAEISDLDEIVRSLVNVAGTAYSGQVPVEEFVQIVVDAIRSDQVVELSDTDAAVLSERLTKLASSRCLEVIAKGSFLLRQNDRNFQTAQIATDMRPICLGTDLKVSAGLILHQLAIHTTRNGRREAIFVTLDSNDLAAMSEVVSRATKKERSLREFADSAKIPILIPVTED